jgi:arylsulfate sulfotransferase
MVDFASIRKLRSVRGNFLSVVAMTGVALTACGGGGGNTPALTLGPAATQAATSDIVVLTNEPGVTPFINFVHFSGSSIGQLAAAEFSIAPKPGSVSKAVDVWYSIAALSDRGDISPIGGVGNTGSILTLPVYGLYAGYANQVTVALHFNDGSTQSLSVPITTTAYTDPTGIYDHPVIKVARVAGSTLGFDFFVMKSGLGSPIIVDTDAEIRWAVPGVANALSTALEKDEFVIGDPSTPTVYRLRLDGTLDQSPVDSSSYTMFHHNIDPGKQGFLAEFNATINGVDNIETNVAEISDQGAVLNRWDLAAILSAYMTSQGDNASAFVRPGVDWFHNNATTYDPSDDSIIVSSRENFIIKLDYATGNIIWILGDPTKYWYTFPSLRAKALTLAAGGLYPLGQHGISIITGGLLMLFNDGLGSANQPAGQPAGAARTYSAVSAYSIDTASLTAQNVWNFDYGQSIYSNICSSAYESADQSILVDYAVADNYTHARLVGLDPSQNVVFDFQYPTTPCNTSWNALPIALDNLTVK